ncbi:MAG TPA: chromate resistance protein ChrB domain-containing protein [Kofleriaceae bacterium]|jgi:hypothetical protein|nr:chromate resistance protein ChrB domain-containing protein [Kofleriaceae bacterium]
MSSGEPRWLLLIHQLPAKPAYLRVKVWRRLQRLGAIGLRGSVYVLPRGDQTLEDFAWLAKEIRAGGGDASIATASWIDGTSDADLEQMFRAARDADYRALADDVRALARRWKKRPPDGAAEALASLRARKAEIVAIDFFGASGREAVAGVLGELDRRLEGRPATRTLRARDYRGRTWVTRTGIHVDRIASAWLIRRFIDPDARFELVSPKAYAHQSGHLRFDMSDGEFTHEGEHCSFETLVHRFALADPALHALAEIIHDIDLKDDRFGRAETAGVAQILAGIAAATADDGERLARGSQLLDGLYASFATKPKPAPRKRR